MSGGFYLMTRGWMDHYVFKDQPYSEREAWEYLISSANYTSTKYRQTQKFYDIPRGDLATSYRSLAQKYRWSTNKLIRFLKLLHCEKMISLKTEHGFIQITICNYEEHQSPGSVNGTEAEHGRNTGGTRVDTETNTNVKEIKEIKENKEKSRGTRFALQDPAEGWIQFCKTQRPDLEPGETFDGFRDYWIARPGKEGIKLDWTATWRNWVRNQKSKTGGLNGRTKTKLELAAESVARARAERERSRAEQP